VWIRGLCFEAKHPLPAPNYNLAGSAGFWKSHPALDRPDLMLLPVQVPLASDEIAARYPIPPNAFAIFPCLVRPRSRGYLRLRTADPNGPLEIQPNFLAEQADVEALASCVELGLDLAEQPAYGDLVKRWVVPPRRMSREASVAFVRRSCSGYVHTVGTCAMGPGREAVVDAELRVRGVEGLRVADASGGHLRDGAGPGGGGGRRAACPRRRGAARRRRLGYADDPLGQHQRPQHHDRRVRLPPAGGRQRSRPNQLCSSERLIV
jgi:choline dehydrogenase